MSGFAGVTEELEKHPLWIALAVVAVAILAFVQRGNASSAPQEYAFAGGGAAAPTDPGAVAIEEASIAANTQNFSTVAGLIGLRDTNATALQGSLAQTSAARDVELAQTSAARDVGLAGVQANEEIENARTSADIYNFGRATDAQITAAQISAGVQRALIDSNQATESQRIAAEQDTTNFQTQSAKDIARAADNTSIVDGLIHLGGTVLSFFGF